MTDSLSSPALFPESSRRTRRKKHFSKSGVFPSQRIRKLIGDGHIFAPDSIEEKQIQPASLDLRLGSKVHRLQASFLPGKATVGEKIDSLSMGPPLDISEFSILERGCVYLAPLLEELRLPDQLSAKANPKSTTGRLDIFTRLITDYGTEFERVSEGYAGPLYAEIMPRTFPVVVRPGVSLSQIRFIQGQAQLTTEETEKLHEKEKLVFDETNPVDAAKIRDGGLEISVNLRGRQGENVVGYKGKKNAPLVNFDKIDFHEIEQFWDAIPGRSDGRIILNPGDFYILASRERVRVPTNHAAEMVPFDPTVGEFRIHYAGFFDPGFGYGNRNIAGTRAVLEVRAHETPFVIEHGQVVGRLVYSRVLNVPKKIYGASIGSSYQRQELALSKQFRRPARPAIPGS